MRLAQSRKHGRKVCGRVRARGLTMVLRFPDLPDALQHYFVTQLSNETTAGRLAQASQACMQ